MEGAPVSTGQTTLSPTPLHPELPRAGPPSKEYTLERLIMLAAYVQLYILKAYLIVTAQLSVCCMLGLRL